jgi:hypothetical protein
MTALTGSFRRRLLGRTAKGRTVARDAAEPVAAASTADVPPVDLAPNDPLLGYLQSASGSVDIEALQLDSPGLRAMKDAGMKLAVPLVSQGELIGVLSLGARRSEQEYSTDDRKLLDNLAAQAAPALRVGQLVRQQQAEARTRQRFEQELEVARLIQQNFLPKHLPDLPGWEIAALYRPAREVGGDFYDVIPLEGVRGRRRHRQGCARCSCHGRYPKRSARLGAAPGRARRGVGTRERASVPRHAGEDVRHLLVWSAGTGHRPLPVRKRRSRPPVREDGGWLGRAASSRNAARTDDRDGLRGA